jgi:NAD(P)-dependent dehydrogenase (short-subunit alcohol dehydrogenase family)
VAKDDGYQLGLTLPKREVFLTSDEEEEVGPLRWYIVKYGGLGYTRNEPHYIATKMGIIGFMRGLANDVANDGITANSVLPGLTNTQATASQPEEQKRGTWEQQAIKRLGEPGDVTGAVLFLTSDDAAFITGQAIVVDGGQYRIG